MKSILVVILVSLAVISAIPLKAGQKLRGCYYSNWSQHRPGTGQYWPELYEPGLCSHIFFAFVGMDEEFKLKPTEKNDLDGFADGKPVLGLYTRVNELKKKQADLQTVLSFGGQLFNRDNDELMRKMLATKDNRQTFVGDVIKVVRKHKFDGFDIHWFPTADTKGNFVQLVKEMREAFEKEKDLSKLPQLLLIASVPPTVNRIKDGYDGEVLSAWLDYFNVMSFDYHGSWENQTGFNSPISDRDGDGLSINSTIRHLIDEQHVPAEKLILGMPAYGRGWTISSSSNSSEIPTPAIGPSPAQNFTTTAGMAAYFEICSMIETDGFVDELDEIAQAPFVYENTTGDRIWLSFDNVESFHAKVEFMFENDLAGVVVWTLDTDDFDGRCVSSNGKYPLIKVVRNRLNPRSRSIPPKHFCKKVCQN